MQQNRAQLARAHQHIKTGAHGALVFGRGTPRRGVRRRGTRLGENHVVRESLPQLGGEQKARIRSHAIDPLPGMLGTHRRVKRSIDFDGVEELRQIRRFMKAFGTPRWIDVAGPIGVRPARRPDAYVARRPGQVCSRLAGDGSFWV